MVFLYYLLLPEFLFQQQLTFLLPCPTLSLSCLIHLFSIVTLPFNPFHSSFLPHDDFFLFLCLSPFCYRKSYNNCHCFAEKTAEMQHVCLRCLFFREENQKLGTIQKVTERVTKQSELLIYERLKGLNLPTLLRIRLRHNLIMVCKY